MRSTAAIWAAILAAAVLTGCGGGGGGGASATCETMMHPEPCGGTTVTGAASTTAASLRFVSADTTNIALQGTGGFGRQESSRLRFEVMDANGDLVSGAQIAFTFADSSTGITVGGLTLTPATAVSGTDGAVTTVVSAGSIPTSIRVVATIVGSSPARTSLSNVLVVSTGVPDQRHFSLSTETGNCEGGNYDQTCSVVTATVGDHFGNPAPDGTAVNFTSEGGVIDASCVTGSLRPGEPTPVDQTTDSHVGPGSGTCSVTLRASSPRTANGRVTVLAYAAGEENFLDFNGNNACDGCDTTVAAESTGKEFASANDKSPDIFRDDNEDVSWNPGEPCVGPNSNGSCTSPGDGRYNGVLRTPRSPSAQTLYVSRQLVQIFSGSNARIVFNPSALSCAAGETVATQVTITDGNGNPMPAGTKTEFSAVFGTTTSTPNPVSFTTPNYVLGIGSPMPVQVNVVSVTCPETGSRVGSLKVTVTTPNNVLSSASVRIN